MENPKFFDNKEVVSFSPYKHILSSQQFTHDFLDELLETAEYMKLNEFKVDKVLKDRIVSLVFYEASTRTRLSFESASLRLGGCKIHTENAAEFSSVSKGESLEDTIRIICSYSDFVVLRHWDDNSSLTAAKLSHIPVINAGSGKLHHPTQALLDVFTINKELNRTDNLSIVLVGDLLRGRTCDSLVYLMSKFKNNHFIFIAPENCKIKQALREYLQANQISFEEMSSLDDGLKKADVVYMTRIQKERFDSKEEYLANKGKYVINQSNVELIPKTSIILHPLPRIDEIHPEVDDNPRSKYFVQAQNGLYVRMAIFKILNDHLRH